MIDMQALWDDRPNPDPRKQRMRDEQDALLAGMQAARLPVRRARMEPCPVCTGVGQESAGNECSRCSGDGEVWTACEHAEWVAMIVSTVSNGHVARRLCDAMGIELPDD